MAWVETARPYARPMISGVVCWISGQRVAAPSASIYVEHGGPDGLLAERWARAHVGGLGEAGENLAGDELDLRGLVAVRDQDEAVHPRRRVGRELGHALLDAPADGVLDRGFAPRGHVPLGLEPPTQRRLGLGARATDVDRELVRAGERLRVAPRLVGEAHDLRPRAPVALGRVEVREPAVALRRDALQDRVHVAADQDRRARPLDGSGAHHRLAQVELVPPERHAGPRPPPGEDPPVPLEEPA